MLTAVLRMNVNKLRKVADAGLRARKWLRKISGREEQDGHQEKVNDASKEAAKNSLKVWAGRALLARVLPGRPGEQRRPQCFCPLAKMGLANFLTPWITGYRRCWPLCYWFVLPIVAAALPMVF